MSIVKRLATLMGGTATVSSVPASGSTFTVTLDLARVANQPVVAPMGAGRRVLLVDDNAVNRNILAKKLNVFAFDVVTAAGTDEAVQILARDQNVDIVIADEWMPGSGGIDLLTKLRTDGRFAEIPLILLSVIGADSHKAEWAFQPDAIVLKPTRSRTLAATVSRVLTGQPEAQPRPPDVDPNRPSFAGARILVVEDNVVNQRVAQHLLEKLGIEVVIAGNGAEGLTRLSESSFDAVLMDCQMPVMDGYTATRQIRDAERQRGGDRLPIIALTANVMRDDRDSCTAAGMDAHLAKPMDAARLAECLGRVLRASAATPALDLAALRTLTGGDEDFERELLETFISSGDESLARIVEALRVGDFETIGRRAHSLKGAGANIHAQGVAVAAASLESAANTGASGQIDGLVRELTANLMAVKDQWRATG